MVPHESISQDLHHKTVQALTAPFILHNADMQAEGLRVTFSPALYELYLQCAGYTTQKKKQHIYKLAIDENELSHLKEEYENQFNGALQKKAAFDFKSACALLSKDLLFLQNNNYEHIISFLKRHNALIESTSIYGDLQSPELLKTDEQIISEMVERGPFIDRTHLEMILALHDFNSSLGTLYLAAEHGTEVSDTDAPPSREVMELIYMQYLDNQHHDIFYDFYVNNHLLMERLQDENLHTIPASQKALCYWLEHYEDQISLNQKEKLAVLCAKVGYSEAFMILCHDISPDHIDLDEQETLLEIAVKNGHMAIVRVLLEKGADPNLSGSLEKGPIHEAALLGASQIVEALISAGADISMRDQSWRTALHIAAQIGDLATVIRLVGLRAPLNLKDKQGNTALSKAAELGYEEITELLVSAGASTDSKNDKGLASLYLAAVGGHSSCVEILLKASINQIDDVDFAGATALHKAVERGHRRVAEILVAAGANPNIQDASGTTALHKAMLCGDLGISNTLRQTQVGRSISKSSFGFKKRAVHKSQPLIKALFSAGGIPGIKYHDNLARHAAAYSPEKYHRGEILAFGAQEGTPEMPLHEAAARGHLTTVATLLKVGANTDLQNSFGKTPLHLAAAHGEILVVQAFLQEDIDLECVDLQGQTALHFASEGGHAEVVALLLRAGINPDLKNKEGYSALHLAVRRQRERCVFELLASGANPDVLYQGKYEARAAIHIAVLSNSFSILRLLLEAGASQNLQDSQGNTALHLAITNKNEESIALLLAAGARLDLTDKHGRTASQLRSTASISGMLTAVIENHHFQNRQSPCTELWQSVRSGNTETISELVKSGVNLNFLDEGESLLDVAVIQKNQKMIKILIVEGQLSRAFVIKNIKRCVERKELHELVPVLLTPDIIKLINQYKLQKAPVAWAAQHGCLDAALAFINAGSKCDQKDESGQTALDYAMEFNNQELIDILLQEEHTSMLQKSAECFFPYNALSNHNAAPGPRSS